MELLLPGHWLAPLLGLSPGTLGWWAAAGCINVVWWSTLLRTALVVVGRKFGLYHPSYYARWPRLPWRSLVSFWSVLGRWYEQVFVIGQRATGGFAGPLRTLALMFRPGRIFLGRAQGWGVGLLQPVGLLVERHMFMYAMTGAGKTVMLISILSTWTNSVFVIDPKAQITKALRHHDWRRWFVIDPYNIAGAESACFNVFDCIKEAVRRFGADAAVLWAVRIAQALIVTPVGSRTPFFTDTARAFLASLILHVFSSYPPIDHNLPFVRDLIVQGLRVFAADGREETKDGEAHALLIDEMLRNPAFDGAVAGGAAAMASAGRETAGNVRSTLQEQTKWLDLPALRKILLRTSLLLSALKTRNDVVLSLTAPVLSIREELAAFCRLLTNMGAYTFEAVPEKNGQCLTIVDELPSQGHNETFEVMLAVARSYGQTVLGIAQNIELMQKAYPKSWGTFSGEADAVFWMASNHSETAAHLSQVLGRRTLTERDRRTGRKSYRDVAVMDPDQVKRFLAPDSGNLIVTRAGARALKLKLEPYYRALPVCKYAPDPAHRESFLRQVTRRQLLRLSARRATAKASTPSRNPKENS